MLVPIAVSAVLMIHNPPGAILTLALRREIAAERKSFKTVGQKKASQIGVPFEVNAEKIEDFAFEPVGTRPDGHQGIDDRMLCANARAQAEAIAAGNGDETVVEFETGLDREAVDTGSVAEEIKLQGRIVAAFQSRGAEELPRHNDGGFTAVFDHLGDRLRIPRAKLFDYNTSVCIRKLRHVIEVLLGGSGFYFCDLCQSNAPFFQR